MENKLLEEKHQRKLLQDCTEQVIILYKTLCVYSPLVCMASNTKL